MLVLSFLCFLGLFIVIGALSACKSKGTGADYLTARGSVPAWLAGLSAVATTNSGYMFIGMIGYTYAVGLSSMWVLIGWIGGDFAASFITHAKLRDAAIKRDAHSYVGALARWSGTEYSTFRLIGGLLTLIILGVYAAAQLTAGGKALHSVFGWDYNTGSIIGGAMALVYCLAGGIRASIWTDAAQSFVMAAAMAALCVMSVSAAAGVAPFTESLANVHENFLNPWSQDLVISGGLGIIIFVLSWFCSGVGVAGQPHIMVRFMALKNANDMRTLRVWYYGWYILFSALTVFVGLAAKIVLPGGDVDNELALPRLAQLLFSDVMIGFIMAGLFAATMSTADSLILSCTAALTRDIRRTDSIRITKLTTVAVAVITVLFSIYGSKSVFSLVVIAWSALSCGFGPILMVLALGGRPSERVMTAMAVSGVGGVVAVLGYTGALNADISEVPFGMAAAFMIYGMSRFRVSYKPGF